MTRGLVWGKFLPLHLGHGHLIETARAGCDELVVVPGARDDEPWPLELRESWLRETFPWAEIRCHADDLVIDYDVLPSGTPTSTSYAPSSPRTSTSSSPLRRTGQSSPVGSTPGTCWWTLPG
jgi:cytidyltransferase-like protein